MTRQELAATFDRAEQAVNATLAAWTEKKFTREQIVESILKAQVVRNGVIMQAFFAAILAERLIKASKQTPGKVVHILHAGHTACMMTGTPKDWPAGHVWSHDWEHVTCKECLHGKATELNQTYRLSEGGAAITCLRCGMTSHNHNDVEKRYCGKCHVFHDDIWPPARRYWVTHP